MRQISLFNQLVNLELILLLAIVVVGVFLRVVAQNHLRVISPDGVAYVSHASRVLEGEGDFERRGPFFQLLLMISFKIFGTSFESSILVPQFFGCIIPILLFLSGKRFFDSKTGLVAALLGSLNPMLINLSCWVLRETFSLTLILMIILTAHSTIRIESKKRSYLATILSGFLSGLTILTREEMLFIIPPAHIAYMYLQKKGFRGFIARTCFFLVTTLFTITPWLLYSSVHFRDPFYSYAYYINAAAFRFGSAPGTEAASQVPVGLLGIFLATLWGVWIEITALPAIFSLFGFVFLSIGVIFTIRKRAIWIIYLIMGLDLLVFAPLVILWALRFPYELMLFPYRWVDIHRIIFSGMMPAIVIAAYGIVRLTSLLSDKER